jgi:MFS family permease
MISASAVVGVIGAPFAGVLVDRIGPRRALIGSLALSACASLSLAFVTEVWHGFMATALLGLGPAAFWPSIQSLLSTVVEPQQRSSVFSVHYMMLNAGIGLGGITGGLIADISSAFSFQLLYFFDALTYLPFIALLLWALKDVGGQLEHVGTAEGAPKIGYLAVLMDRVFHRVWALMALLVTIGYSQLESGFPAYATGDGGIGTRALGFALPRSPP